MEVRGSGIWNWECGVRNSKGWKLMKKTYRFEVNLINPIITINQVNTAKLKGWKATVNE